MGLVRVSVVMPAFNESAGIVEFLGDIEAALCHVELSFVVVDDFSSDRTARVVEEWAAVAHRDVTVIRNAANHGHGISTVTALCNGLASGADVVVAVDGDGQFSGDDVARVVSILLEQGVEVVEGARQQRGDPLFRRGASAATRTLVRARCGTAPRDANTPLRAYRPEVLRRLLACLPPYVMTPNLLISSMTRRAGLSLVEVEVMSRTRRGPDSGGSTWNSRRRSLPSRRFVGFCKEATVQWFSVNPALPESEQTQLLAREGPGWSLTDHAARHTTAVSDA